MGLLFDENPNLLVRAGETDYAVQIRSRDRGDLGSVVITSRTGFYFKKDLEKHNPLCRKNRNLGVLKKESEE